MRGEKAVLHKAVSAPESAAYWDWPDRWTPCQSQQSLELNIPQQEDGYGLVIFAKGNMNFDFITKILIFL